MLGGRSAAGAEVRKAVVRRSRMERMVVAGCLFLEGSTGEGRMEAK